MKESKFIELLNLYVDHHISPSEGALLEAEVRSNPARHRIYREYCQMQRACHELAETFRAGAPAGDAKLVDFAPRRRSHAAAYAAGFVAVAACAAVVITFRPGQPTAVVSASVPATIASATVKPSPATVAPTSAARPALQPVFGPRLLTLHDSNTELSDTAGEQAALAEWMNSIQLSSLPGASPDDLRFDATATLQPEPGTYRTRRPLQGKVEWTAFTFQK